MKNFNYLNASRADVIERFQPYIDKGDIIVEAEGRLRIKTQAVVGSPWLHAQPDHKRNCPLYHFFYFPLFNFIHSVCQECWKVVLRPQTVSDLAKTYEWQKTLGRPCKSGIEKRSYVFGNYGSYWYNDSLEEGLECLEMVKDFAKKELTGAPEPLLKRGCTEYEMKAGPSDKWVLTDEQKAFQEYLDELVIFEIPDHLRKSPPHFELTTKRRWIEFAYDRGDETYKEFTDGRPLHSGYVTY